MSSVQDSVGLYWTVEALLRAIVSHNKGNKGALTGRTITFAPLVDASVTSFRARRRFAALSAVVASCINASRKGLNVAGIKLISIDLP